MARFEPNPKFEQEMQEQLRDTVQQVLDEVSRTHPKRDEAEVRRELTAAAARHGIHNWTPPDDAVKAISEGRPVVAR